MALKTFVKDWVAIPIVVGVGLLSVLFLGGRVIVVLVSAYPNLIKWIFTSLLIVLVVYLVGLWICLLLRMV